jgi:hypothetical protein
VCVPVQLGMSTFGEGAWLRNGAFRRDKHWLGGHLSRPGRAEDAPPVCPAAGPDAVDLNQGARSEVELFNYLLRLSRVRVRYVQLAPPTRRKCWANTCPSEACSPWPTGIEWPHALQAPLYGSFASCVIC